MPENAPELISENCGVSKLMAKALMGVVSVAVAAPYVILDLGAALLCSCLLSALITLSLSMIVLVRGKQSSVTNPGDQLIVFFVCIFYLGAVALSLVGASIGVFFHFMFWKAAILCVAITLSGALFMMLTIFVLMALNRGLLEKNPIDPDAPR